MKIINYIKNYFNKFCNNYNAYTIINNTILYFILCCIIDYFNIIGKFIPLSIIIILSIFIFILISFIKNKTYKELKNNKINNIDLYLINLLLLIPLVIIDILIITINKKMIYYQILIISLVITIILLLVRIIVCNKKIANKQLQKKNYNLYDLYKNKIKKGEYVILDDIEVTQKEYDLIGYNEFVDNLSENLIHNTPKERFAIGLIGKWGTGKTSIVNLMKEKSETNELKIIEFKPWIYEDNRELFKGLYNKIFEGVDKKNNNEINSILKQFEKIIFGAIEKKYGFNFLELNNPEKLNDIEKIKKIVNEKISNSSERIVIVIDDIDRLEKKDILFIFKVINQIFDFQNIIYILCYDEERINKMFTEELIIDKEYLEKIIQSKIYIPMVDEDIINNILSESLHNLININDIRINDLNLFYVITQRISKTIKNIREILSFLNCISQEIEFVKKFELDIIDFLIIQYIKIYDYKLYEVIYRNKMSFVESELYLRNDDFVELNRHSDELEGKLTEIENNKPVLDLLNIVFPNIVGRYIRYSPIVIKRKNISNNHNCKNEMYFERYFFTNKYTYMDIEKRVNNFTKKLNETGYKKDALKGLIRKYPKEKRSYIFKLLTNAKNSVKNKEYIIDNIIKNLGSLKTLAETNSCIYETLFSYMTYISEKKIKEYVGQLIEIDRMFTIRLLKYSKKVATSTIYNEQIIVDLLKQTIQEDINHIYDKKIDIFSLDNSYKMENLREYLVEDKLYEYFKYITNESNIFKIAFTLLSKENDNQYNINRYRIEDYFSEKDLFIKKVISSKAITKDQKMVQEIYTQATSKLLKFEINEKNL